MEKNSSIRLNKVLKELNISLDRAVEYIQSKNYDIEFSPNSKITLEIYQILQEKFQVDKSKKIESKEIGKENKLEKEKMLKEFEDKEVIRAKRNILKKPISLGKIDLEKKTEVKPKEEEKPKEKLGVIRAQSKKLDSPRLTGEKISLDALVRKKKKPVEKPTPVNKDKKNKSELIDKSKRRKRISGFSPSNRKPFKHGDRNKNQEKKVELTDEEIQKKVRDTLEKLQGKSSKSKGAKYRKEKRDVHKQKTIEEQEQQELEDKILKVTEFVTVTELSNLMEIPINQVISVCMSLGIMVTMNQRLDAETLTIVADEFGYQIEFINKEFEEAIELEEDKEEELQERAPIITVMGHVDHGKTSLLDYIRKENVIAGESGGITQHIGAYSVKLESGQTITFLDTPGHEAFTAMRARGTSVTDIAIIVVAADDDIMPQTKEAISHAQAGSVPIIIAINKIDKANSNAEKIKEKLANMNLLVEDWGGKIQSQEISAKTGQGVNELLEKILLEAELLELKANPNKRANGTVIEASLDKGRGYLTNILVQSGVLKVGDYILAGQHSGKIKAIHDERGSKLQEVFPSTPATILGIGGAPQAGDKFQVFEDEKEAKQIAIKRSQLQREQNVRVKKHITLDEIGRRIALGDFRELNIIIKGDVDGSVEALTDSIQKLSSEKIQINVIHKSVGSITESDVLLAQASNAIIIGFNTRPVGKAKQIANKEQIDIKTYSIIYTAIDDIKSALEGMLSPEIKEEVTGSLEVRETFKISKIGTIAGCMVLTGKIFNDSKVRVIREGIVKFDGKLESLKRFKDDVKQVTKGFECGIQIKKFNDLIEGDVLECYSEITVKRKL